MEIDVNDSTRIVEIWLTNTDQKDPALCERLPAMYREFKSKGYLVAVFKSGLENLSDKTLSLLLHNREVFAKRDIEAEKASLVKEPA